MKQTSYIKQEQKSGRSKIKHLYFMTLSVLILVPSLGNFSNAQTLPDKVIPIMDKLDKIKGDTVSTEACDLIMEGFRIIREDSIKQFKKDRKNKKNPDNVRKAEERWDEVFSDIDELCKKYIEMKATVRRLCTKLRVTYMPAPC